jgi:hypothetical protein
MGYGPKVTPIQVCRQKGGITCLADWILVSNNTA